MENEIVKKFILLVYTDGKSLDVRICDTHIARENGESRRVESHVERIGFTSND